jgi:cytochrome c551/c552
VKRYFIFCGLLLIHPAAISGQQSISAKSTTGMELLRDLKCTSFHLVKGEGAGVAPDLSNTIARNYSPMGVAAQIWNHAPTIWHQFNELGISCPQLTEAQWVAIFAYFTSARYFEMAGDARRGKQIYQLRRCSSCHATSMSKEGGEKPVPAWNSLNDPIAMACALLNRPHEMTEAVAAGKPSPAPLTPQEVTDLLIYLRHQPETRGGEVSYAIPDSSQAGRSLFNTKGCRQCHTGRPSQDRRSPLPALSGFVAAMWNHSRRLQGQGVGLACEELPAIVGYLWCEGLFDKPGNSARGQRLFARLGCGSCHGGSGKGLPDSSTAGPATRRVPFCAYISAAVWNHGSAMMEGMRNKGIAWPKLTDSSLADLGAYLQESRSAKGASW